MKGLFIKDWRLMGRQLKIMLVFVLVFVGMFSFTMENNAALSGFYAVFFTMLSINCFAYDEACHFDKLAAASPIPKKQLVLSRYLAALSVGALGVVVIAGVHGACQLFQKTPREEIFTALLIIGSCFGASVLFISVLFPIFYKFGVNKSRLIMIMAFAIPGGLIGAGAVILQKANITLTFSQVFLRSLPFLLIAIIFLGLWLSISISTRILENKEY